MDENRVTRMVDCRDVGGRNSVLQVIGEPGAVFIKAPPGEVARLTPQRIEDLKKALNDALVAAVRSEKW